MIKILATIIISLIAIPSFAQTDNKLLDNTFPQNTRNGPYQLFMTQNMWTFIKLDTRNGQMWQVQFGMKEDSRLVTSLSLKPLVPLEKEVNNRFTLYPTQNIYTFILIDQFDGRTWQVQWSIDPDKRGVIPIE